MGCGEREWFEGARVLVVCEWTKTREGSRRSSTGRRDPSLVVKRMDRSGDAQHAAGRVDARVGARRVETMVTLVPVLPAVAERVQLSRGRLIVTGLRAAQTVLRKKLPQCRFGNVKPLTFGRVQAADDVQVECETGLGEMVEADAVRRVVGDETHVVFADAHPPLAEGQVVHFDVFRDADLTVVDGPWFEQVGFEELVDG